MRRFLFPSLVLLPLLVGICGYWYCISSACETKKEQTEKSDAKEHKADISALIAALAKKSNRQAPAEKTIDGQTGPSCSVPCEIVKNTAGDPVALFTLVLCYVVWLQFLWMTRQERVLAGSVEAANKAAEAAKEQVRVAIKSQLPVIGWIGQKLIGYTSDGAVISDPAPFGMPPTIFRPEFGIKNAGPTRVVVVNFALTGEIAKELGAQPHYGRMAAAANIIDIGQEVWLTHGDELITVSPGQAGSIQRGDSHLWIYGFLTYLDYLDERHEIGFCFRWSINPPIGFVNDGPPAYTYTKSEKRY